MVAKQMIFDFMKNNVVTIATCDLKDSYTRCGDFKDLDECERLVIDGVNRQGYSIENITTRQMDDVMWNEFKMIPSEC